VHNSVDNAAPVWTRACWTVFLSASLREAGCGRDAGHSSQIYENPVQQLQYSILYYPNGYVNFMFRGHEHNFHYHRRPIKNKIFHE